MFRICCFSIMSIFAIMIAGCSSGDSGTEPTPEVTTASGTIGSAGGSVEIAGAITLTVPPSALSSDIDFTITKNNSPAVPGGTMGRMSSVYSIGPSGTEFDIDAELEITYNPSGSGLIHESTIVICNYEGSVWEELTSVVDQGSNIVSANISGLSDFSAMADTSTAVEGVFAKLVVARAIMTTAGYQYYTRMDSYEAVFDSAYGICDPIEPIHNVDVSCNSMDMVWFDTLGVYMYPETPDPFNPFITLGETYTFTVTAGNGVPALSQSVVFPSTETIITTPAAFANITRSSGMLVEWTGGQKSGNVDIVVMGLTGEVGHFVQTDNDGSHFISATDMNKLAAGIGSVILSQYNREAFSATGYDSRSFKAARTIHTQMIVLN